MRSARFISPSAKVGGRSVSQNLEDMSWLPFRGVHEENGVEGASANGSIASLAHEARRAESRDIAVSRVSDLIGASLSVGYRRRGFFARGMEGGIYDMFSRIVS
jgi:hypothetical protein